MDWIIDNLASGGSIEIPDQLKGILKRVTVFVDSVAVVDGTGYLVSVFEMSTTAPTSLIARCGYRTVVSTDGATTEPLFAQLDCNIMLHKNQKYYVTLSLTTHTYAVIVLDILPVEKTLKAISHGVNK